MSYIPPHRRQTIELPPNVETNEKPIKYSGIFKKKEKPPLKKGWVQLTKKGLYHSLTAEEIKNEEEKEKIDNLNKCMQKLMYNHEKDKMLKYEKNGYVSEEPSLSSEQSSETAESNNEEYEHDDEELDIEAEKYEIQKNKWASS